ncbi:MAG: MBL fold metallo-hydrolase [Deltaproteobacteria bacterium]|nr:MBL fold metallo-hydrolase [Deltaproteobacteria bacterium]
MSKFSYRVLLPGVPASSTRGSLGWCTVSIIEYDNIKILFDTGSYGDRSNLLHALKQQNIAAEAIDIVFISHLHYDHCINAELFPSASILVSERELEYVLTGEYMQHNDPYVPYSAVAAIKTRLVTCKEGDRIAGGMSVRCLPGHTPGSSGLYWEEERILFAGDAVKNGWDFTQGKAPPAFHSEMIALKNYSFVKKSVSLVVPGHDRPFHIRRDGSIEYAASRLCETITVFSYPHSKIVPIVF